MYSYISGQLVNIENHFVTIDVGGIGYEIACSTNTLIAMPKIGSNVKLYCYLYVREDEMSLDGFNSREEKSYCLASKLLVSCLIVIPSYKKPEHHCIFDL